MNNKYIKIQRISRTLPVDKNGHSLFNSIRLEMSDACSICGCLYVFEMPVVYMYTVLDEVSDHVTRKMSETPAFGQTSLSGISKAIP